MANSYRIVFDQVERKMKLLCLVEILKKMVEWRRIKICASETLMRACGLGRKEYGAGSLSTICEDVT